MNDQDGHPVADIESRNVFWACRNSRKQLLARIFLGTFHAYKQRATRWYGLNFGTGLFQTLYLIALLHTFITILAIGWGWWDDRTLDEQRTADSELVITAETSDQSQRSSWASVVFSEAAIPLSAVVIFLYKNWSSNYRKICDDEIARRDVLATVIGNTVNQLSPEGRQACANEARRNDICQCIERDVQHMLQVGKDSLSVALLVAVKDDNKPVLINRHELDPSTLLHSVGRNRARTRGWASVKRPILASYAFEAIRLERSVVFHDTRESSFSKLFPDESRPYRSVYATPLISRKSGLPYGCMTVNLKAPYALWPGLQNTLDKLLIHYLPLIDALIEREEHSETIQYELF